VNQLGITYGGAQMIEEAMKRNPVSARLEELFEEVYRGRGNDS